MSNPITIGYSPLTNTIFAGRAKPFKGAAPGAMKFTGEKFDVTQQALAAVAQHMVTRDDILLIPMPDGRVIHLRADIKDGAE